MQGREYLCCGHVGNHGPCGHTLQLQTHSTRHCQANHRHPQLHPGSWCCAVGTQGFLCYLCRCFKRVTRMVRQSEMSTCAVEMLAIMDVLQLPPRESRNTIVMTLLRYGTCGRAIPMDRSYTSPRSVLNRKRRDGATSITKRARKLKVSTRDRMERS